MATEHAEPGVADPQPGKTFIRWGTVAIGAVGFAAVAVLLVPGELRSLELPPEFADEPDVYLEDSVITRFRDDGTLHYRLRAERISQFERDRVARLTAPVLELHEIDGPPWTAESRRGDVFTIARAEGGEEDRVELQGEVRLTRDIGGPEFVEMRTEYLVFLPERRHVRTDQTVMIETSSGRVVAAGFDADLASRRVEFFASANQRISILVEPHQQNGSP